MSDASGREPGGWELLRAIQSINTRLDDFAKGYVSAEVFALHVERVREVEADLAAEKAEREKADAALRQTAEERRKAKRKCGHRSRSPPSRSSSRSSAASSGKD